MQRDLLSNSVGRRELSGNVVVAKGNSDVFCNVTSMHDVGSSNRDLNFENLAIVRDLLDNESHLLSTFAYLRDI